MVAMNTLNAIIDGGEADNAPLSTGFPFPGTSHYAARVQRDHRRSRSERGVTCFEAPRRKAGVASQHDETLVRAQFCHVPHAIWR